MLQSHGPLHFSLFGSITHSTNHYSPELATKWWYLYYYSTRIFLQRWLVMPQTESPAETVASRNLTVKELHYV